MSLEDSHPVRSAIETMQRVPSPGVLVAVSGGKDSLCILDLCYHHFKRAVPFTMSLVPGKLECEWELLRPLERRYGLTVLSVPHYSLSGLFRDGIFCTAPSKKLPKLKQRHVEQYLRQETGIEWSAWGIRSTDSIIRAAMLRRIKGVDSKFSRVYPIWAWRKHDVYGYLRAKKLPIPRIIGGGDQISGGVNLRAETLLWLKQNYPNDYRLLLERFPFAEAQVFRLEKFGIGNHVKQISKVHNTKNQANRAHKRPVQSEDD